MWFLFKLSLVFNCSALVLYVFCTANVLRLTTGLDLPGVLHNRGLNNWNSTV